MHLKLLLPDVKTTEFSQPKKCPRTGCAGVRFYPRQIMQKKIVDTQHKQVSAWRYQCAKCGCTFRVYQKEHTMRVIRVVRGHTITSVACCDHALMQNQETF